MADAGSYPFRGVERTAPSPARRVVQGARDEQVRSATGAVSPGPLRWFWYALSGRLPARYHPWVLHDLTCRTWPLRHLARLLAQLAPVAIVLVLLLPGPLWVRVMGAIGGSLVGLAYSFVFLYEATEGRATKAGYPHGTLNEVRNERHTERALRRAAADFDRACHHRRQHL